MRSINKSIYFFIYFSKRHNFDALLFIGFEYRLRTLSNVSFPIGKAIFLDHLLKVNLTKGLKIQENIIQEIYNYYGFRILAVTILSSRKWTLGKILSYQR